jgi:hypothetical protein
MTQFRLWRVSACVSPKALGVVSFPGIQQDDRWQNGRTPFLLTGPGIWGGAHCKGAAASDANGLLEQQIAWCVPKRELNSTLRLGNSI